MGVSLFGLFARRTRFIMIWSGYMVESDNCLHHYLFIHSFISCTGVCVDSYFLLLLVRSFLTPWVLMAQIQDTQSRSQSTIRTPIRQTTSTSQILRSSSISGLLSFWGCCSCDLMYIFLLRQIYLLVLFLWYQIHFFCTLDVYSFGFVSAFLYLFVWSGLDVHMDYVIIYLCFIM